jgi:uncharacterized protein YicC (UPF0701 family)
MKVKVVIDETGERVFNCADEVEAKALLEQLLGEERVAYIATREGGEAAAALDEAMSKLEAARVREGRVVDEHNRLAARLDELEPELAKVRAQRDEAVRLSESASELKASLEQAQDELATAATRIKELGEEIVRLTPPEVAEVPPEKLSGEVQADPGAGEQSSGAGDQENSPQGDASGAGDPAA